MIVEQDAAFAQRWVVTRARSLSWARLSPSSETEIRAERCRAFIILQLVGRIHFERAELNILWYSMEKPRNEICREKKKKAWAQKGAKTRQREEKLYIVQVPDSSLCLSPVRSRLTPLIIVINSPSALAWASSSRFLLLATQRILSNTPWIVHLQCCHSW